MLVSAKIVMTGSTKMQYAELRLIYGKCQTNAEAAATAYAKCSPRERHLTHETITNALHFHRKTDFDAPRLKTCTRASCYVRVKSENVLPFALKNSQLTTV